MKCESCGSDNRDNAKFCESCGEPLGRACSSCGAKLKPGSKFCMECGTPASATAPGPVAPPAPRTEAAAPAPKPAPQPRPATATAQQQPVRPAAPREPQKTPEELILEHAVGLDYDKVYVGGLIPEKKMKNVRETYAQAMVPGEDEVLLIDDTVFGSAKDGVLFTQKAIYAHNQFESSWRCAYEDLREVARKGNSIIVNGQYKMDLTLINKEAANKIERTIAALVELHVDKLTPESQSGNTGGGRSENDVSAGSDFIGVCRFYGSMKWFSVAEQPENFDDLPAEFLRAKKLWDSDADRNMGQILELMSPHVGARFIASNISGWEELFADFDGSGFCEIESTEIRVVGIDFSEGPIPMCKAEANFEVPVTRTFESSDLDEWQDENGHFTDAVIFYWNVPRNSNSEDLDFTCGDNQGVECVATNERAR